jgi:uncharacterized protein DUF2817
MLTDRQHHNFYGSFFSARTAFRELVENTGGRLDGLPLDARGPQGETLGIDIAWFGTAQPRRVVLHSSGIHGVEGFAGSAIQIQALTERPRIPDGTALVLVHVLNPYGMSWLRRTNENNVDLNRNAVADGKYAGAPENYSRLDSFLNPSGPPSRELFLLKTAALVLRYGMPALRQAVAGGQYEFPKGLFFGGKKLEQGLERYQTFLSLAPASVERIVAIDVHTGLGKYGEDTLLADPKDFEKLKKIFGPQITSSEPQHGPAYRIRGGLDSLISRAVPRAELLFVTQEFGTFSAIKNLHALREENRWHHYGRGPLDHPSKQALREAFNPDDEKWRSAVLNRGKAVLDQALSAGFSPRSSSIPASPK